VSFYYSSAADVELDLEDQNLDLERSRKLKSRPAGRMANRFSRIKRALWRTAGERSCERRDAGWKATIQSSPLKRFP
jgi:hypothetical protein